MKRNVQINFSKKGSWSTFCIEKAGKKLELQKYISKSALMNLHTFSTPCIFTLTSLAPQIAIHNGVKMPT